MSETSKYDDARLTNQLDCFTSERKKDIQIRTVPTRFPALDVMLNGGLSLGITVLVGLSGAGKSTFALQMAENLSAAGQPVLYISLEMSKVFIAAKSVSRAIFTNCGKLSGTRHDIDQAYSASNMLHQTEGHELSADNWERVITPASIYTSERSRNLYVYESGEQTRNVAEIEKLIVSFAETHDIRPVVIIDYLQIVQPEKQIMSEQQAIESNIKVFSALSQSRKIPIVLLSSMNRSSYKEALQMSSLKGSGLIEYAADCILGIQYSAVRTADPEGADNTDSVKDKKDGKTKKRRRKRYNIETEKSRVPRLVDICVLKQRYGQAGGKNSFVEFRYFAEHDCFIEKEEQIVWSRRRKHDLGKERTAIPGQRGSRFEFAERRRLD